MKKLDIKGYICLICGQKSGKEGLKKRQEKGIATATTPYVCSVCEFGIQLM